MKHLRRVVAASVVMLLSSGLVGVAEAATVTCGDVITRDTTLEADLGPCPGVGLWLDTLRTDVTLDLGGHTIFGTSNGTGILAFGDVEGLDLHGSARVRNGTLSGFRTGVGYSGIGLMSIEGLHVRESCGGVRLDSGAVVGIFRSSFSGAGSTIDGPECHGILSGRGSVSVLSSSISDYGGSGVVTHTGSLFRPSGPVSVRGSVVSNNKGDGLRIYPGGVPTEFLGQGFINLRPSISGNRIAGNFGDGVHIGARVYGAVVETNSIAANGGNGVFFAPSLPAHVYAPLGARVVRNVSRGNGVFDLADGNPDCGAGLWEGNVFDTRNQPCIN